MNTGRGGGQLADELVHQARELGYAWGKQLRGERSSGTFALWPGNLEAARALVEERLGPVLDEEHREPLAIIVERGARLAWQMSSNDNQ